MNHHHGLWMIGTVAFSALLLESSNAACTFPIKLYKFSDCRNFWEYGELDLVADGSCQALPLDEQGRSEKPGEYRIVSYRMISYRIIIRYELHTWIRTNVVVVL